MPFEILIFKISGNGDYAAGPEGDRFLQSIRLESHWLKSSAQQFAYRSPNGAFSATVFDRPFFTNGVSGPGQHNGRNSG